MRKHLLLLVTLTLCFQGCASTGSGPKFVRPVETPKDKAVLYVYREHRSIVGAAGTVEVFVNDQLVGTLSNGEYFKYQMTPGDVVFGSQPAQGVLNALGVAIARASGMKNEEQLRIRTSPGGVYYVQWVHGYTMALRDYEEAKDVLANCGLSTLPQ